MLASFDKLTSVIFEYTVYRLSSCLNKIIVVSPTDLEISATVPLAAALTLVPFTTL